MVEEEEAIRKLTSLNHLQIDSYQLQAYKGFRKGLGATHMLWSEAVKTLRDDLDGVTPTLWVLES